MGKTAKNNDPAFKIAKTKKSNLYQRVFPEFFFYFNIYYF